eukprot:TRINITY_DN24629_c0_g1_i1.p1 TRINITY_DN24629_c0_g1~~TRINITY_DN24629_c0_g1_i1.p1  ORF type:complete len:413 (+),score=105.08 TRINITY_DN24629_c0_g1_i1:48-1241(+)
MLQALLLLAAAAAARRRVVAIGDLHGDFHNGVLVLRQAGLVDEEGNWTGGSALLVQMGDLADRGPEQCELYDLFSKLRRQSADEGGEVVSLYGNHEMMNLAGNPKYTSQEVLGKLGGRDAWRTAFHPQRGRYGKMILDEFSAAHQAGPVLFIHGGLLTEHAKLGVEGLREKMHRAVARRDWNGAMVHIGREAPVWTRLQIRDAEHNNCTRVTEALKVLNSGGQQEVTRIVVGHTVQRQGIAASYCGGQLVAMDVAVSGWMPGPEASNLGFLEVNGDSGEVEWYSGGKGRRRMSGLPKIDPPPVRRVSLREGPGPWSWSWPRGTHGTHGTPVPSPVGGSNADSRIDGRAEPVQSAAVRQRRYYAYGMLGAALLLVLVASVPRRLWLWVGLRRSRQDRD